jgi:hypothetical protein
MTEPREPDRHTEDELRWLLSDAVADIDPADALDSIHDRTKVTPMSARRPWLFAVGGAVVATAAVVTAVAFAGGSLTGADSDPGPAGQTSSSPAEPDPSPSQEPTEPEPSEATTSEPPVSSSDPVPVYFAGETPQGTRLFREFQPGSGDDALLAAALATVEGTALDGDYRSLWPAGSSVASVTSDGADVLTVDVTGAPRTKPAAMTAEQAQLALQQVVYSVQAAHGQGRVGVQLLLDGERTDQVLGQPTSEPLANAPILETLSMMNITSPGEGDAVSGVFEATGVNNSFEATVIWQVLDGDKVVAEGFGTAAGWGPDKLFPWTVEVDLSELEPGDYTFVAMNDDPSGGTEGAGPHSDSRRITVVE